MTTVRSSRRLSPEERREVLVQLGSGTPIGRVAQEFGVGRETVRRLRDRAAVGTHDRRISQPVATRIALEERQAFDVVCAKAGYRNRSDALRALICESVGMLEFSKSEYVRLDAVTEELRRIGVNVNQMARLAHSGRLAMDRRTFETFSDLTRILGELRSYLGLLNAERRRRGLELFRKCAEAADG